MAVEKVWSEVPVKGGLTPGVTPLTPQFVNSIAVAAEFTLSTDGPLLQLWLGVVRTVFITAVCLWRCRSLLARLDGGASQGRAVLKSSMLSLPLSKPTGAASRQRSLLLIEFLPTPPLSLSHSHSLSLSPSISHSPAPTSVPFPAARSRAGALAALRAQRVTRSLTVFLSLKVRIFQQQKDGQ